MAFLKALLLVFIAEMGDKTQLMCMAFAGRFKIKYVIIGVTFATFLLNSIAAAAGSLLSSLIPFDYVKMAAGICFIGFGIWTLKSDDGEEDNKDQKLNLGPIMTVAVTFFIAELGDKTQLMTIALSAQFKQPVLVMLGASIGMLAADGLGAAGGAWLSKHVPKKYVNWGTAAIFIVFGLITLLNVIIKMF